MGEERNTITGPGITISKHLSGYLAVKRSWVRIPSSQRFCKVGSKNIELILSLDLLKFEKFND